MAIFSIKSYYSRIEDEDIVFHPVITDIPTYHNELDLVVFRNSKTLRINKKLWDRFTDTVAKEVSKKLKNKGRIK